MHLRSDFLPAQLSGTLHGADGRDAVELAAALNGRIVAVGRSFTLAGDDGERFSVMLPEGAFHEGRNRVELLSVTDPGGGLWLASLARASYAAATASGINRYSAKKSAQTRR